MKRVALLIILVYSCLALFAQDSTQNLSARKRSETKYYKLNRKYLFKVEKFDSVLSYRAFITKVDSGKVFLRLLGSKAEVSFPVNNIKSIKRIRPLMRTIEFFYIPVAIATIFPSSAAAGKSQSKAEEFIFGFAVVTIPIVVGHLFLSVVFENLNKKSTKKGWVFEVH